MENLIKVTFWGLLFAFKVPLVVMLAVVYPYTAVLVFSQHLVDK